MLVVKGIGLVYRNNLHKQAITVPPNLAVTSLFLAGSGIAVGQVGEVTHLHGPGLRVKTTTPTMMTPDKRGQRIIHLKSLCHTLTKQWRGDYISTVEHL